MKVILRNGSFLNETGKFVSIDEEYRFRVKDNNNKLYSVANRYMDNGMFIISAFRDETERTPEENLKMHEKLCQEIRDNDLGFVSTLGGFIENKGTPDEANVDEISLIVPYRKDVISEEDFVKLAVDLCREFNQDSVLVCVPWMFDGKPTYLTKSFDVDGQFKKEFSLTNEEDIYYTKIKRRAKGNNPNSFTLREMDSISREEVEKRYIGNRVPKSFQQAVKLSKYNGNY